LTRHPGSSWDAAHFFVEVTMHRNAPIQRHRVEALTRGAIGLLSASVWLLLCSEACRGDVLVDEKFSDASRFESKLPAEAAVWVGREQDVTVAKGSLSTTLGDSSQKIWTYFTEAEPVILAVGQKLTASLSFIPRKALATTTSRSFRVGLFHDPTSERVEDDVNNDGGGSGAPWTDSQGYAVQVLITGGEYSSTNPFDLGKRTNLSGPSLLGTSGDYTKMSGGTALTLKLDTEYRLAFEIAKISEKQIDLTVSLYQGDEQLSTFTLSDDGSWLGTTPIYDKFDQLFIRIADNVTTADQIDFMNFKVVLDSIPAK
jgi:hypothetical protein